MSLKKKIFLSFLMSSIIIAILVIAGYTNFLEIKKEIGYLELSDTLRSKTLELRRHEKNFLLYGDKKEVENVHIYINDLKSILIEATERYNSETLQTLQNKVIEYERGFSRIEEMEQGFLKLFSDMKPSLGRYSDFFRLIESTYMERPLVNAEIFTNVFRMKEDNPAVESLRTLSNEIAALRSNGEDVLSVSKAIDRSARQKVDRYIRILQAAALFLFPLFLFVGLGASFIISHNIVKRLKLLTAAVESTGRGDFSPLAIPAQQDEVGTLIRAFIQMEHDLIAREEELAKKNTELLQSKKLAAIGTLASGVAHELNNPLNNIYTSAQRLMKKVGDECPPHLKSGLNDIFGQTMRVKQIVADLLEFARGREPNFRRLEVTGLISDIFNRLSASSDTSGVRFVVESSGDTAFIEADPVQIEQVFNNIFVNALEAMSGSGTLKVLVHPVEKGVTISISDSGKGIPQDMKEKIFEPFFTTKDKGTGLGLAIVFNIIQKHHGEIRVESRPGQGTVFIITLPDGKEA